MFLCWCFSGCSIQTARIAFCSFKACWLFVGWLSQPGALDTSRVRRRKRLGHARPWNFSYTWWLAATFPMRQRSGWLGSQVVGFFLGEFWSLLLQSSDVSSSFFPTRFRFSGLISTGSIDSPSFLLALRRLSWSHPWDTFSFGGRSSNWECLGRARTSCNLKITWVSSVVLVQQIQYFFWVVKIKDRHHRLRLMVLLQRIFV